MGRGFCIPIERTVVPWVWVVNSRRAERQIRTLRVRCPKMRHEKLWILIVWNVLMLENQRMSTNCNLRTVVTAHASSIR